MYLKVELLSTVFLLALAGTYSSANVGQAPKLSAFASQISWQQKPLDLIPGRNRLPLSINPINYNLLITPILEDIEGYEKFRAPGLVEITFRTVDDNVQQIKLRATHSRISVPTTPTDIKVTGPGDVSIEVTNIHHPENDDLLTITLSEALKKETHYIVSVPFNSILTNGATDDPKDQEGLYISTYTDGQTTKYLATTHFEPIGARKAFPCFDEPAMRATFNIRIGRSKNFLSLSNAKLSKHEPHPDTGLVNYEVDIFEETPSLPTYLVALHVSQYVSVNSVSEPDKVKVWGPPGYITKENARFSADVSAEIRQYYSQYFNGTNIGDRLAKLDSVAVPHFPIGAMENWGLNNHRMQFLIFNKDDMTQYDLFRQPLILAHEIAHIWYGNLVTIKWWNEMWVKEGLATYLQFLNVEHTAPKFKAMDRFVLDNFQVALESDNGAATHPIWEDITDRVPSTNSRIIYEKGASLMHMMEGFLTAPIAKQGLIAFLEKYKESSATQLNFFQAIDDIVPTGTFLPDQSVASIMNTWTTQSGFPLVRVACGGANLIYVSQEKYFTSAQDRESKLQNNGKWDIPIALATKSKPTPENYKPATWIRPNVLMTSIVADTSSWILVNPNAMSYYRVLYDVSLFELLKSQLTNEPSVFSVASRAQLIDDYFNFADHGYTTIDKPFDLTLYLNKETSLPVWTTVLRHLRKIQSKSSYASHFQALNAHISHQIGTIVDTIETNPPANGNDQPVDWILRALLLDWACKVGRPECKTTMHKLMGLWMENSTENPIQPDIQATVYCAAFAVGTEEVRTFLRKKYNEKLLSTKQKEVLISAQACQKEEKNLKALLESTLLSKELPIAHKKLLIGKVAENIIGQGIVLEFLHKNYALLPQRDATLISALRTVGNFLSTESQLQAVRKFLDIDDLSEEVENSVQVALRNIKINQEWNGNHSEILSQWLQNNSI